MRGAFHTLTTCILLCVAALPLFVSVYFQASQCILHHQMREELEQKNLVTITINKSELTWTEADEALINGKLFDIKEVSMSGDEVRLTGLFDEDEDALIAQLYDQEKNNPDADGSSLVLEWFSFFSFVHDNALNELCAAGNSPPMGFLRDVRVQTRVLACETPPPKPVI